MPRFTEAWCNYYEIAKTKWQCQFQKKTERIIAAILRALVDLGLASGASPRSTEQRAMRAVCGYVFYAG